MSDSRIESQLVMTLVKASALGNADTVKLLLDKGVSINSLDKKIGWTALMHASLHGRTDIVRILLDKGAHVDIIAKCPLVQATESCDKYARILQDEAAIGDSVLPSIGYTALMPACYNGHIEVVKLLLERNASVDIMNYDGDTALITASTQGHTEVVKLLLNKGAQVDFRSLNRSTALMNASSNGYLSVVKLLLDKGAQINLRAEGGVTALQMACQNGHTDVVQLLLEKGADVNFRSQSIAGSTTTPLEAACYCGYREIVKLLLEKGAEVNFHSKDHDEWSALMIACQNGNTDVVKMLLNYGAHVNFHLDIGCTALMIASQNGYTEIVEVLLSNGADSEINLCMKDGVTALFLACQNGHIEVVQLLLDNGAQIDFQEIHGKTALMTACAYGHKGVVKLLIDHGADIYIEGEELCSALTLAADRDDIISLLLDCGSNSESQSKAADKESESKGSEYFESDSRKGEQINFNLKHEFQADSKTHEDDVLEKKLLDPIEMAIKGGETINHVLFHGVFLGPPRSGKDSLMKRLMGEMPSDISPSTGAAERVIHIKVEKSSTVAATMFDSSIWTKLEYDEEAVQLMKMLSRRNINSKQNEKCTNLTEQETEPSKLTKYESEPKSETQENKFSLDICSDESLARQISLLQLTKNSSEPDKVQQIMPQRKCKNPIELFKEAIKTRGLEGLKKHYASTYSIYLTNTGGQIEFQEILPLLVSGPSVFFITFQLHKSITATFSVVYDLSNGLKSKSYQSHFNVLEVILQTLSSIAAMGTYTYQGLQRKAVSLRPKVFIIGTHKDLLDQKSAKAEIKSIDNHLQEVIKSTSHHYKGIIQFATESQMIFAVNNHDPNDLDFQRIRLAVENLAENYDYWIRSPAHWMIFSLVLRQLRNRVETYDNCYAIAKECGIKNKEEFNQVLRFIHTKMGLIRYFPHKDLQNLVIIDPQILFEKVTELIVETFTFEKASSQISFETFKQMGIFSLSDLERSRSESDIMLTPVCFTNLLEHLRIAARFKQDGVVKFFLPCALAHATEEHANCSSEIPKLLITFKCGYCPKGLPGSLITYLMTNEMKSEFEWELMTKQMYRNEVSFQVGPHDIIILQIYPTHLEIICTPTCPSMPRTCCTVEQVCKEVRRSVDKGIKTINSALNYIDAQHSFTFYCTLDSCSNHPHPAKVLQHQGKFGSLKCELKNQPVPLPSKYGSWEFDSTSKESLNQSHITCLNSQLSDCAAKWRQIGSNLGFYPEELNVIESKPLLLTDAPQSWLFFILSEWIKWTPGDSRGSTKYANLNDLKSAVSKAGFGVIAANLSL